MQLAAYCTNPKLAEGTVEGTTLSGTALRENLGEGEQKERESHGAGDAGIAKSIFCA